MIRGRISQTLDPLIAIEVRNAAGAFEPLEVILDTGFTGHLMLPHDVIQRIGLEYGGRRSVILASGEVIGINAYTAIVSWDGRRRDVIVLESTSESLLGMSLLQGSRVTLDVLAGGDVLIEQISLPQ